MSESDQYRVIDGAKVFWPCDMPDDILTHVIKVSKEALTGKDPGKQGVAIAEAIQKQLNQRWDPHWHVVVGQHFGSHTVHDQQRFVHLYLGPYAIMAYKAGRG